MVTIYVDPQSRTITTTGNFVAGEKCDVFIPNNLNAHDVLVLNHERALIAGTTDITECHGHIELATEQVGNLVRGVASGRAIPIYIQVVANDGRIIGYGKTDLISSAMPSEIYPLPPDITDYIIRRSDLNEALRPYNLMVSQLKDVLRTFSVMVEPDTQEETWQALQTLTASLATIMEDINENE